MGSQLAYMLSTFFLTLVYVVLGLVFLFTNRDLRLRENKGMFFANEREWQVFVAFLALTLFVQLLAVLPGQAFRRPTAIIQMAGIIMLLTVLFVYWTASTFVANRAAATAVREGSGIGGNLVSPILFVAWGFAGVTILMNLMLFFGIADTLEVDY